MLLYQPPFLEVADLMIYRDDKNPNAFYYAVGRPSIVMDENNEPTLSAYAILPKSGLREEVEAVEDAGISLEVDLAPKPETLELAKEQIKELWGKEAKSLNPVPISDGKVYMIVAQAGEEPDPENWFVTSAISPSIIGNNNAALVVNSQGANAEKLVAALNGEVMSGTVYYELNMLGISPVFNAKMTVDWSKVYTHFEEFKKKNMVFVTKEISKTVDDLKETSAIDIQIEELDPDVKNMAGKALFNELKTKVIENLFKPATSPLSASKKWEDRIANGASRVYAGIIPGSHYILREVEETQQSTITINLNERRVKKYPFYPQSLLSSMIKRAGGLGDRLKWIKLDDLPFRSENVQVALAADTFNTSNIKSVKVDCRIKDLTLGKTEKEETFVFDSKENIKGQFNYIRQENNEYEYEYRATIFLGSEASNLPSQLEKDWTTVSSAFIYFNAAEYFESNELIIGLDDSDVFNYGHLIEATITVKEEASGDFVEEKTFIFKKGEADKQVYGIVSTKDIPLAFDLSLTYFLKDSKEHSITISDLKDYSFFIPNPFENKWNVNLITHSDWEEVERMIVEIRVYDTVRDDFINEKFEFESDKTEEQFNCVSSLETPKEEMEYRVTMLNKDTSVIRGAWKAHRGPLLVIRDKVVAERTIKAKLAASPDFELADIKKLTIQFRYKDESNNLEVESEKLRFNDQDTIVKFTHNMPDFNQLDYEYQIRAASHSGERYKTGWVMENVELLGLRVPEDLWDQE